MCQLRFFGDLQSEVIFSQCWEAAKNVLITWFSIAEKQDDLCQVYAAPALTNKRAAFICALQSESGSYLVAAQNNMQSYFDRPNDTLIRLRLDVITESKSPEISRRTICLESM